jgi:hypothetical protein
MHVDTSGNKAQKKLRNAVLSVRVLIATDKNPPIATLKNPPLASNVCAIFD